MHKTNSNQLSELFSGLINLMKKDGYCAGYIQQIRGSCDSLAKIADKMGKDVIDEELSRAFLSDFSHFRTGKYSESRFMRHKRCLHVLQTYQNSGIPDWNVIKRKSSVQALTSPQFIDTLTAFVRHIKEDLGLKRNTTDGYSRFVYQFLVYCEKISCLTLEDICDKDIPVFLKTQCQGRYQPTSIGGLLPSLKLFFSLNEITKPFLAKFPKTPRRKKEIIPVLRDHEYELFKEYLKTAPMSARNRTICWLAFETGLRAVDMANLKITDIDFVNDVITIIQQKTSKPLELPLRATYGNAISEYLVNERPQSNSTYLFLSSSAPFRPLVAHGAYYAIILNAFRAAGIEKPERICGTRFTRHNAASHMLKSGIPLYDVSAALGHSNPNSVDVYLATDEKMMVECCLPIPCVKGAGRNE